MPQFNTVNKYLDNTFKPLHLGTLQIYFSYTLLCTEQNKNISITTLQLTLPRTTTEETWKVSPTRLVAKHI